jgi:hypothetical protein
MRTIKRRKWLLSLVGPVLLAGCQMGDTRQAAPQPCGCHASSASPKTPAQAPLLPQLVQPAYGGTTTAALVSYGTVQPTDPPPAPGDQSAKNVQPAGLFVKQPTPATVPVVQAAVPPPSTATAELPPAKSIYPRGELTPSRKSFTDITAHSSFGHAPDYTWISGEATTYRSEWRLRYASVDEIDAHGGSLVLTGEEQLDKLKDSEHYKLVGHVEPHSARSGGEAFYVEAVEPAQ